MGTGRGEAAHEAAQNLTQQVRDDFEGVQRGEGIPGRTVENRTDTVARDDEIGEVPHVPIWFVTMLLEAVLEIASECVEGFRLLIAVDDLVHGVASTRRET